MTGGHSHVPHGDEAPVRVNAAARAALLVFLVLAAAATVFGLVRLWPGDGAKVVDPSNAFAAPGVTFHRADVISVQKPCPAGDPTGAESGDPNATGTSAPTCGQVAVEVTTGSAKGKRVEIPVPPEVSASGLRKGDVLEVMRTPPAPGAPAAFSFFSVHRNLPIGILAAIFVLVVGLVARLRGLLALVGLGFGAFILVQFMLPALLEGSTGLGVAIVGSASIMFVVLYLAHGVSIRTSAALAGTLGGVGITALIAVAAVSQARLSGISDESGALLSGFANDINFQACSPAR